MLKSIIEFLDKNPGQTIREIRLTNYEEQIVSVFLVKFLALKAKLPEYPVYPIKKDLEEKEEKIQS